MIKFKGKWRSINDNIELHITNSGGDNYLITLNDEGVVWEEKAQIRITNEAHADILISEYFEDTSIKIVDDNMFYALTTNGSRRPFLRIK